MNNNLQDFGILYHVHPILLASTVRLVELVRRDIDHRRQMPVISAKSRKTTGGQGFLFQPLLSLKI